MLKQQPPLKVVRAFPISDGGALVHLHNISGGILGGDHLTLTVQVGPGAFAQITSTSATRIYRTASHQPPSQQFTTVHVAQDGLLEYLPDPLIPFSGARYRQHSHVVLEAGAGLFWWETVAPGRTARDEIFAYDSLQLSLTIASTCRPLAIEHFTLTPARDPLQVTARLGPYTYLTSFYICKVGVPATQWQQLEHTLSELAIHATQPGEILWGVSTLASDGLVIKALSRQSTTLPEGLYTFWQTAKHILYARNAQLPRKIY